MRLAIVLIVLAVAACTSPAATNSQSAPPGAPSLAGSGAGPQPGASAGSSVGGGPAGTGTADSAGGAK